MRVFLRTPELEAAHAASRIWREKWLASFFRKPCNYALFVRQNLNLETAIAAALAEGLAGGWIAHIDTDELLHPGGAEGFSMAATLARVPAAVGALVLPNYESAVERDDVDDPFVQATLFKARARTPTQGVSVRLARSCPGPAQLRPRGAGHVLCAVPAGHAGQPQLLPHLRQRQVVRPPVARAATQRGAPLRAVRR